MGRRDGTSPRMSRGAKRRIRRRLADTQALRTRRRRGGSGGRDTPGLSDRGPGGPGRRFLEATVAAGLNVLVAGDTQVRNATNR